MEKYAESGTAGIPRRAFNNPRAMDSLGSSNLSNNFSLDSAQRAIAGLATEGGVDRAIAAARRANSPSIDLGRSVASPSARSVMRAAGGDPTVLTRIAADKAEISRTERITRGMVRDALSTRNAGNPAENQRQLDQARRNLSVIESRVETTNNRILGQIQYLQGRAVNDPTIAKASIGLANKLTREYNGNNDRLRKLRRDVP